MIGQGDVLTTPIQVVQMMNLIATRGNTHAPGLNINNSFNEFNLHLVFFHLLQYRENKNTNMYKNNRFGIDLTHGNIF